MTQTTELLYGKIKKTAKEQMRSLIPYVDLMKISDEETELYRKGKARRGGKAFI